ncbi:MAG: 50S ribosomal protein L5 [Candidatus Ryanbacteria bacterium RIFCSPHIGHO2_02_FULL_45_17b]|uniref:Large ribosomal subunit protein uL5 n=1 Tax=Candidatus Ryanbacteria bacterium RIFCSPHIGHO2_01_FULL_45_22 TaxID=1802114 RepID=A0A1G2G1L5_9BACT|nr:MAG: 50S ribosomal protein L5 [Candidatus Ryanbacteria bacterium RIFCSPHIGHO2_01_FULL_45_22]OGZ46498.1 MAG: 50S ribosomal protein L5 [Candidatus Ryanbacteria bacterium RIFCSPHIGHO2_02_FULL_45_17b]
MKTVQEKYKEEVTPAMRKRFGYSHAMAVPRIMKVVVNVGTGRVGRDKGGDEEVVKYLSAITGQRPLPCVARTSVASFKTRQGQVIGHKVTLRGKRMYDFLERLVAAAIPRTRDFRGLDPKAVDQGGALTIGIREHTIFPETIGEDTRFVFGLETTVNTNAKTREEALALFRLLGFPLKKE